MSEAETIAIAELAEVNPKVDLRRLREDTPVSFIPMSDVSESGQWVNRQERRLDDVRFGYTPFAEDDVLFAKITPCMENGKGAHAVGLRNGVGFGSTEFHILRALGETPARFLYHWLQARPTRVRAIAYMGGSAGQQRVQADFFTHFRVPKLRPDQQSGIAAVLDTVDEAIAKTAAVIAKLRQARAGLLHDLLTRGLDQSGQLRDPIIHPGQFQDSPLGRIPREWDVRQLEECYAIPSRNGLYKKVSCYGFGRRMIHMPQMFKGVFVDVEDAVRVDVDPQELQRYALQEGDILFARRSLNLEGAGLCSMVGKLREPTTFESSIVRVRVMRDIIVPRFALEFLRSPAGYLLRRRFIRQVAVSGVSSGDIAHFLVPCPKPPEQECILSLLDAKDSAIRLVEEEAGKLVQLKSGLMTDLLTGRVPVPDGLSLVEAKP
jgi:type I restriction enzyme S subunit